VLETSRREKLQSLRRRKFYLKKDSIQDSPTGSRVQARDIMLVTVRETLVLVIMEETRENLVVDTMEGTKGVPAVVTMEETRGVLVLVTMEEIKTTT